MKIENTEMMRDNWITTATQASEREMARLRQQAPTDTPAEYYELLRSTNGGECDIPVQPWLLVLWSAGEVAEHNTGHEVERWWPGLFGIGTNGGGEMFAFDARDVCPWPVVVVPLTGGTLDDVRVVAPDFESFIKMLGRSDR